MAIVIFGDSFSFPEGNSATNRIYTYAKGFVESNVSTYVICNRNDYLINGNGIVDGIQYFNPINQTERSNSLVKRNWFKVVKYLNTIRLIKRIHKKDKITAILIDTHDSYTHLFSYYLARKINTKLIVEKSEHPLRLFQGNFLKRLRGLIKLKVESRFCDGILCISQFLVDFYLHHGLPQSKLILIPSTVDPGRFIETKEKPVPYKYIGYFGGLTFTRDNIDVLINAFALTIKNHPDIHLVVGGFCTEKERKQLEKLILDLKLSSKVNLLEYLPRSEIISYIVHSYILVMVRAKDLETQASFPSKLTEYMVTSKPVITVNVGEIPNYLTDGVNAFLVDPGDCVILADKIDYVLNNYEIALEVAQRGKQLTNTIFNYNSQAKRMIGFINSLYINVK
jgi:glycosyltransferase involved in cell wall biosynthesis